MTPHEQIRQMHLNYTGGVEQSPTLVEGIEFYSVGHNASHNFYIGYKDGQKWRLSYCLADDEDAQHLTKVDHFDGYYGHY